jgi:hypothetical protein
MIYVARIGLFVDSTDLKKYGYIDWRQISDSELSLVFSQYFLEKF